MKSTVAVNGLSGVWYCLTGSSMSPHLKFFINQNILQVVFRQNSNASKLCPLSSYLEWIESICTQIFPLKIVYFLWKCFVTEQMLTMLNTFFTLISFIGKRQVFSSWITGISIYFLQKCAWNVFVFKEKHVKLKNTGWIHASRN